MSRIQVDNIFDKAGTGSPTFPAGSVVTGVSTATTFSGNLTGTATNAQGLSGTPNINCGTGSFTGDVSIADKIIHTGDINTAIRFPAADTFTVETAGSERLRITSDGKFGFKTTSPDYTVDINGELGIKEGQPVTWHDGSGNPAAQIYGDSSSNLIFRTGVAGMGERMRLLPAGGLTFNGDTAVANALDDYEEGTWTPTWHGTLNSGTWAATGTYTKIGKTVTIQMAQTGGNVTLTVGGWIVGGLPFTPTNGQTGAAGAITDMSPSFGGVVSLQGSTRIYSAVAASNKTTLRINATFRV